MSNFQLSPLNELSVQTQSQPSPIAASSGELLDIIRKQIEYYFSQENLSKDVFLRNNMSANGHVAVAVIADFARVKKLTTDPAQIFQALEGSTMVAVDSDGIRSLQPLPALVPVASRSTVMLRDVAVNTTVDDINALLAFDGCPRVLSVDQSSSSVWLIRLESDDDASSLHSMLCTKSINGSAVKCRVYSVPPSPKTSSAYVPPVSPSIQQQQQLMMLYFQQQQQYNQYMQMQMSLQQQQQQAVAVQPEVPPAATSTPIITTSTPTITKPSRKASHSSLIQYTNNDILSLVDVDDPFELRDAEMLNKPIDGLVLNVTANRGLFRGRSASMDQASAVAFKQVFTAEPVTDIGAVSQPYQVPSPTNAMATTKKTFSEAARSAVTK